MNPETGAPRMLVTGMPVRNSAIICACSRCRNQYIRYKTIPGKYPASASPSKKRTKYNCCTECTNPVSMARIPQVIRIRAIQIRAPILCSIRLLGISNRKYPKKKIPATNPKLLAADRQFLVHRQRRKPDVDTIKKGDDVQNEHKWNNPHSQFVNCLSFEGRNSSGCFVGHDHLSMCLPRSKGLLGHRPAEGG